MHIRHVHLHHIIIVYLHGTFSCQCNRVLALLWCQCVDDVNLRKNQCVDRAIQRPFCHASLWDERSSTFRNQPFCFKRCKCLCYFSIDWTLYRRARLYFFKFHCLNTRIFPNHQRFSQCHHRRFTIQHGITHGICR